MAKVRKRVVIAGRVQGVFYRVTMREYAQALNVNGWVKNRHDGKVEALLEGEVEDLEKLIRWCYQGPPGARVSAVKVKTEQYTGEYAGFEIKHWGW
ncbi:MAG: acylphosphatase [Spirochaetaceae bacterium]|nr:MAG: acylphosphatase [Spirochaetaceae bacterium]